MASHPNTNSLTSSRRLHVATLSLIGAACLVASAGSSTVMIPLATAQEVDDQLMQKEVNKQIKQQLNDSNDDGRTYKEKKIAIGGEGYKPQKLNKNVDNNDEEGGDDTTANSESRKQATNIDANVNGVDSAYHQTLQDRINTAAAIKAQMDLLPSYSYLSGIDGYQKRMKNRKSKKAKTKKQSVSSVYTDETASSESPTNSDLVHSVNTIIRANARKALPTILEALSRLNTARTLYDVDPIKKKEEKKKHPMAATSDVVDDLSASGSVDDEEKSIMQQKRRVKGGNDGGGDNNSNGESTRALCSADAKRLCQSSNPLAVLSCLTAAYKEKEMEAKEVDRHQDAEDDDGILSSLRCHQRVNDVVLCVSYVNPSAACPQLMPKRRNKHDEKDGDGIETLFSTPIACIAAEARNNNEPDNVADAGDKAVHPTHSPLYQKHCTKSKFYRFLAMASDVVVASELQLEKDALVQRGE